MTSIQTAFRRDGVPLKDGGVVSVRHIAPDDIKALTDVMSSAFKGTPDERPRARVAKYLLDQLEPDPEEVCLVAVHPRGEDKQKGDAAAEGSDDPSQEKEGDDDGEPIGLVSLSFTHEARGGDAAKSKSGPGSIPCPPDAAYLCNMAVADAHRGKGVAKALLGACDDLVVALGGVDVWLHVRVSDANAFGLYSGGGYEVEARESKLALMFSKDKQGVALMRKELVPGGCNAFFTS